MAWNEPGGNDNDPWGNRKDSGSPPDLDEVFRSLKDRLNGLFGQRGGRPNGGSGSGGGRGSGGAAPNLNPRLIGLGIGVLAILWLFSGFYIIQPAEQGVVKQFGAYKLTQGPGIHWRVPWPVQAVERVDVKQIRSFNMDNQPMLTNDENIINLSLAVQYRINSASDYLFRVRNPDQTLEETLESAMREVIGQTTMDAILITDGVDVETEGEADGEQAEAAVMTAMNLDAATQQRLQEVLEDYGTGIELTGFNLQRAQPPEQVQAAFSDAIKAREDRERFINEAEAYRNEILPRARGEAQQALEEALSYKAQVEKAAEGESKRFTALLEEYTKAPQITRDRLYIESMETVLSGTSKVIVDSDSGSNLMYLPIDKLIDPARQRAQEYIPMPSTDNVPGLESDLSPTIVRDSTNTSARSRTRGN